MIISCDVDNVLNNLTETVVAVYNLDSGDNLTVNQLRSYDISAWVNPSWRNKIWDYFTDTRVWDRVQWNVSWLKDYLDQHNGDEVFFCTATDPCNVLDKFVRVCEAFGDETYVREHLITTANKQIIKADIVIDDCIANLQLDNKEVYNLLYARPWNTYLAHQYNANHPNNKPILICDTPSDIIMCLKTINNSSDRIKGTDIMRL